jgi:hypothetical protein
LIAAIPGIYSDLVGIQMLGLPAAGLVTTVAAFLWRRTSLSGFATVFILIGMTTYTVGVASSASWHETQGECGRMVEGKALFDAAFFLSAFVGFWFALPAARFFAQWLGRGARGATTIFGGVAAFLLTLAAMIPWRDVHWAYVRLLIGCAWRARSIGTAADRSLLRTHGRRRR